MTEMESINFALICAMWKVCMYFGGRDAELSTNLGSFSFPLVGTAAESKSQSVEVLLTWERETVPSYCGVLASPEFRKNTFKTA